MKSRTFFEPTDFDGCGQAIVRESFRVGGDISFGASVAYKVGYLSKTHETTLTSLADGMTHVFTEKKDLCDRLNNDEVGYRVLSDDELVEVMKQVGNRFKSVG